MSHKVTRVIATGLFAYFLIMCITLTFGFLVDTGVIMDAWYNMLEFLPFGSLLGPLCVDLFESSFNMGTNLAKYTSIQNPNTFLEIFQDSGVLILTAIFTEAVSNSIHTVMNIKGKNGLHNILMRMFTSMVSVLLMTFIATLAMNFLYQQLTAVPKILQGIIAALVSIITIAGSIGVMYFILGSGILAALAYALIKVILVNALKVFATYVGTLLIILFISEEAYLKALGTLSGWALVIIMLIGVDIMISSVFE